ncbi:MAG: GIY-YIG nuclease family protein, partial [Candidatus Magasanikbacteria bacterium]|nr:GIY-YIG nuclease family protein [Candidatus Magasanikbacteria bacterium]
MLYRVYIVRCKDQTLYTGYTNNLEKRIHDHNFSKTAAKYTRSRRPVKLVYSENYRTLSKALKREIAIKKLSRAEKLLLIKK